MPTALRCLYCATTRGVSRRWLQAVSGWDDGGSLREWCGYLLVTHVHEPDEPWPARPLPALSLSVRLGAGPRCVLPIFDSIRCRAGARRALGVWRPAPDLAFPTWRVASALRSGGPRVTHLRALHPQVFRHHREQWLHVDAEIVALEDLKGRQEGVEDSSELIHVVGVDKKSRLGTSTANPVPMCGEFSRVLSGFTA